MNNAGHIVVLQSQLTNRAKEYTSTFRQGAQNFDAFFHYHDGWVIREQLGSDGGRAFEGSASALTNKS